MLRLAISSVLLCLVLAGPAHAREWTDAEKAMWYAYTITWSLDWSETRVNAPKYGEGGFAKHFIGDSPSRTRVDNFFMVVYLLNYIMVDKVNDERFSILYLGGSATAHYEGYNSWQRQPYGMRLEWRW